MKVFFAEDVSAKQVNAVGRSWRTDDRIKDYQFVSRTEALKRMEKRYPELTANLPDESAPRFVRDHADARPRRSSAVHDDPRAEVRRASSSVKDGQQTSKRILQVARVIEVVFLVAVIVLLAPPCS